MSRIHVSDARDQHRQPVAQMILAVVLVGGFSIPVFAEEATTASPPATSKEESTPEASKKEIQGPAVSAPREILQMLEQRKRDLDKREAALRGSEMHLLELKAELEEIVTRHEQAVEAEKKRRQAAQAKATTEAEKSKTSAKPGGRPTLIRRN